MCSIHIPANGEDGFKQGMKWADIYFMIDDLSVDEYSTSDDKILPLYYTSECFKNR